MTALALRPFSEILRCGFLSRLFWRRAPIGAEKTASGYEVAWKDASTGQYTAWNTDNNGNYVSNIGNLGWVSGTSTALESLETSFHQDLNGDGQIGLVTTVIETQGATDLTQVGDHYFLYDSLGSGPSLKFGGTDFVAGYFGAWAPIGAEKTAGGYEVAWKDASTGHYTAWNTDNNGNYVSNIASAGCRAPARRWSRLRATSIRISMATGTSGLPRR